MLRESGWCLLGAGGSGDGVGESCRAPLCPQGIFILITLWGKFPIHAAGKHQERGVGTLHAERRLFMRLQQPQQTRCLSAQIPLSLLEAVLTDPFQMVSAALFRLHVPAFGMGWQPVGIAESSELPVLSRCSFLLQLHRICCALAGSRVVSELWKCTVRGWNQAVLRGKVSFKNT